LVGIKKTGDIFFGVSDRDWILDGATVHVSMVGFDNRREKERLLDGTHVATINANLRASADITTAKRLKSNLGIAFMGDTKGGAFDIPETLALEMLAQPNPDGRTNSDVVLPWANGLDITRRPRNVWIIDFGVSMPVATAALYAAPFAYVEKLVQPERAKNKRQSYRERWWVHVEPRPAMRHAIRDQDRSLVTISVGKHRLFSWLARPTLADHQLFVFAHAGAQLFGLLHSRIHEVWARAQGTQVRERESGFRYTPTTCFETFAQPEPSKSQTTEIAAAADDLDNLRNGWLNPPEWTREEVLSFPGSVDGPWARHVENPNSRGIGTVRYRRLVPLDDECAKDLAKRTLTNLYNQRPAWLTNAHRRLDEAVFAAYGWPTDLTDDGILVKLLQLNLSREPEGCA
jgi:type II restriction/modification system DNA methylase subunit YeeA